MDEPTDAGVFIRVFDHESEMTPYANDDHALWPGLLDGLPPQFRPHIGEPAFCDGGNLAATAVLWRRISGDRWHTRHRHHVPAVTGALRHQSRRRNILCYDIVDRYVDFAGDYYGIEVDRAAVAHVVAMRPLTDAVVRARNPDTNLSDDT